MVRLGFSWEVSRGPGSGQNLSAAENGPIDYECDYEYERATSRMLRVRVFLEMPFSGFLSRAA